MEVNAKYNFMNKKIILPSLIFVILILVSVVLIIKDNKKEIVSNPEIQNNQTKSEKTNTEDKKIESDSSVSPKTQEEIILFYGDGCPHCAIVEKFITENGIDKKISLEQKEVYYNKQNASELTKKAEICKINTDSIGVPFLWDGTGCLVGDQDIVDFLKLKASI